MSKSWPEVKKLLDDPYVDADTKEHLLAAYMREGGPSTGYYPYGAGPTYGGTTNGYVNPDKVPAEVKEYYDKYKLDSGDYFQGSLDDVYGKAQDESL